MQNALKFKHAGCVVSMQYQDNIGDLCVRLNSWHRKKMMKGRKHIYQYLS